MRDPGGLTLPWKAVRYYPVCLYLPSVLLLILAALKTCRPPVIGEGTHLNRYTQAFCEGCGCCVHSVGICCVRVWCETPGPAKQQVQFCSKDPQLHKQLLIPDFHRLGLLCSSFHGTLEEPVRSWRLSLRLVPRE